jgi:hypothetical protein
MHRAFALTRDAEPMIANLPPRYGKAAEDFRRTSHALDVSWRPAYDLLVGIEVWVETSGQAASFSLRFPAAGGDKARYLSHRAGQRPEQSPVYAEVLGTRRPDGRAVALGSVRQIAFPIERHA